MATLSPEKACVQAPGIACDFWHAQNKFWILSDSLKGDSGGITVCMGQTWKHYINVSRINVLITQLDVLHVKQHLIGSLNQFIQQTLTITSTLSFRTFPIQVIIAKKYFSILL